MNHSSALTRLLPSANFVRAGAVFADIGTDHGYLPIFLLQQGRIVRAVLTDINDGPLSSAKENVRTAGYSDRVEFYLTDGAAALSGLGITDYAICGMGGELIADIISRAPHLMDGSVRLILQPMSKQAHLRKFLASRGFTVLDESYSYADGKYYVTLLAEFDGVTRELSDEDAVIGRLPNIGDAECYTGYLEKKLSSYSRAAQGKMLGGEQEPSELRLCHAIEARLTAISNIQNTKKPTDAKGAPHATDT